MPKDVFRNRLFAYAGRRVSVFSNDFTFDPGREEKDATCFEDGAKRWAKGAYDTEMGFKGLSTMGAEVDLFNKLNDDSNDYPFLLFLAENPTVGSDAAFASSTLTGLKWMNQFGELAKFEAKVKAAGVFVPGKVLHNAIGTAGVTASGPGVGVQLGPLGAGQKLFMCINVVDTPAIAGTNPALGVDLESDVDNAWAAPVSRVSTPADITEATGLILEIDGDQSPITDPYYRVNFTVSGTGGPAFWTMVAAGIINK